MSSQPDTRGYGAVDVPEGDGDFDVQNTYYLKEVGFKWERFVRGCVPAVIAFLVIGGFAYGMTHG